MITFSRWIGTFTKLTSDSVLSSERTSPGCACNSTSRYFQSDIVLASTGLLELSTELVDFATGAGSFLFLVAEVVEAGSVLEVSAKVGVPSCLGKN